MAVIQYSESGQNLGCGVVRIPGCVECKNADDCFDGNEATQDICVAGKCELVR